MGTVSFISRHPLLGTYSETSLLRTPSGVRTAKTVLISGSIHISGLLLDISGTHNSVLIKEVPLFQHR